MKKAIKSAVATWCVALCVFCVDNLHAQTIVDDLQSHTNVSDGIIRIRCDSAIIALIGKPNSQFAADGSSNFVERNGYRIQVFMEKVRAEASSKQQSVQNAFPELSADLRYEAPNWRLLVGDFISYNEAISFQQRLQKEFPQFGKEMYIVSDKIKLYIER